MRTPHPIDFLRRTGLGFCKAPEDRITEDGPETEDLGVGPVGSLGLDLEFQAPLPESPRLLHFPFRCTGTALFCSTLPLLFASLLHTCTLLARLSGAMDVLRPLLFAPPVLLVLSLFSLFLM